MIRFMVIITLIIIGIVVGLTSYLGPDDLSHCQPKPTTGGCRTVDAIVAVSGGDTLARTNEAIRLYKNGWSDTLIFSGAALDKSGPSNAAVMREAALAAGVPPAAIMVEEYGSTTKENARNTEKIFVAHDIKSVILVTSAYHQRRASLEFSKRVAGTVSVLNHPVAADDQWSRTWWLTPTGWYLAVSEIVKIFFFYIGGTR